MVALKPNIWRTFSSISFWKQERRGGIETIDQVSHLHLHFAKQERRGGIETLTSSKHTCIMWAKQERRSGIETGAGQSGEDGNFREAGTPWWH